MSNARVHIRNLASNWVSLLANMVVLFFLSRYLMHTLGKPICGIWSLLNVIAGYMGLFDLGVRSSTGRYIILYLGKGDHARVDQTIRTGLGFFTLLGGVILLAGCVAGIGFPKFFPTALPEYRGLVMILLPIMALNVWLSVMGAVFSSVLTAHDRWDLARGVDMGVLALRAAGTVLSVKWGMGLLGLVLVTIACNLLGVIANSLQARRIYPRLRVWPLLLSRERLRELAGYGVFAALSTIAYRLMGQTDLVIVGMTLTVDDVAVYSVGAMAIFYSWGLISQAGQTFFPPVQRAIARGDIGSAKWLYLRQARIGVILGVPMYIGFLMFGYSFLHHWMFDAVKFPESSVQQAFAVMVVLSWSRLVFLFGVGAEPLLAAIGQIKFNAIIACVEAALNLALSIFFVLVWHWGLAGVAAGTLVSRILIRSFVSPWRASRAVDVRWTRYAELILGGLAAGALFTGWCWCVQRMFADHSWATFALQVALALAGYAPMAFLILVSKVDQKRVLRLLRIIPPAPAGASQPMLDASAGGELVDVSPAGKTPAE